MPPRAHAHGGGDEEEVVVIPTNGPPFVDLKADPGSGFECDFHKVELWLGPGKISKEDFDRDIALINAAYFPTAHQANWYLQRANILMLGALCLFIIMGMAGGTPEIRGVVNPLCVVAFLLGLLLMWYARWLEQPGIRKGASVVRALLDNDVQPRYADHPSRLRWTIRVNVQKRQALHMGKVFVERPILSIWALRSPNEEGVLMDWPLPEALMHGLMFEHSSRGPRAKIEDQEGW